MVIAAEYYFNGGEIIKDTRENLLNEVHSVIASVDALKCKTKRSEEITMPGKMLFSPKDLNNAFADGFEAKGWEKKRVNCDYPTNYYREGYSPKPIRQTAYREMDFLKERLGVEVQFGKYAFMVYNVCAKMTIFHNLGYIDMGVEIVPIKSSADDMSTGVSYFEQFVWDLEQRGVANIDIPVIIYGIDVGENTPYIQEEETKQLLLEFENEK